MRNVSVVGIGIALLLMASAVTAADKPQDLIVGKWEAEQNGQKITAEFKKDGTVKLTHGDQMRDGKYKFTDDKTMEVEIAEMEKVVLKTSVSKDELSTTNEKNNRVLKFKRVKE